MLLEVDGSASRAGVAAAVALVAAAVLGVAFALFGGGAGAYTVEATFINAGQLVDGNLVQVAGMKAGTVDGIEITESGQAQVTLEIDDRHAPLPVGTRAEIRQASQSGVANRFVELRFPDSSEQAGDATIDTGGTIRADETTTAVDLDQLFNTLDPETRRSLQDFIKGSARQYAGQGENANRAFQYLNPSLSQTSRVFHELNRDTPTLERYLLDSATLATALAHRRDDLTDLVTNLSTTTRALGNQQVALAGAVGRLPDFMRRSSTTFANLRGALGDLDPLVNASKPVARKLRPFLDELRPFATDARPTVADLNDILRRGGGSNDLVELIRTFSPLADITVNSGNRSLDFGTGERDLGERRGAFAETVEALRASTPLIAQGRPYTPDLFGWFDDFSNTGIYDALGGIARANISFNVTSPQFPDLVIPDQLQDEIYRSTVKRGQYKRCPGGAEAPAADGSNVLSEAEQEALDCREDARALSR